MAVYNWARPGRFWAWDTGCHLLAGYVHKIGDTFRRNWADRPDTVLAGTVGKAVIKDNQRTTNFDAGYSQPRISNPWRLPKSSY